MWTIWMGTLLGLAQGLRHAFEPDHLAAVSTVVAEQRSARASAFYAACWGIGHAAMLLVVGGALYALRREMPGHVASALELAVAAMLVALGVRAIVQAVRAGRRGALVPHRHGGEVHTHAAPADHVHLRGWTLATRPLLIGVVHGLAGSGALTALVAASFPSAGGGFLFILVYGLGAMIGMALLGGFAGLPLARVMRTRFGAAAVLGAAGSLSLAMGLVWGFPIVYAMTIG